MHKKGVVFAVVGILVNTLLLWADTSFTVSPQTKLEIRYAAELYQVPAGCRIIGMGNCGDVLVDAPYNFSWNPALLALSSGFQSHVEGAKLYGNLSSFAVASIQTPMKDQWSVAFFYKGFFPGTIEETDSLPGTFYQRQYSYHINGYPIKGFFHNNQHNLTLCLAKKYQIQVPQVDFFSMPIPLDAAFGVNIKSLVQTVTPSHKIRMGYNCNLDVGGVIRAGVDYDIGTRSSVREIIVAMTIQNFLMSRMIWLHSLQKYEEQIHPGTLLGISFVDRTGFCNATWTVAASVHTQYEATTHIGIEADFYNAVSFRCGLSDKIWNIGTGIRYKKYQFDYCFSFDEIAFTYVRIGAGLEL